jgi:hypothetical protein
MRNARIAAQMTVSKSGIRRSQQSPKTSMISIGMGFSRTRPDFDGHEVDWVELVYRRRSYLDEEVRALSEFECNLY